MKNILIFIISLVSYVGYAQNSDTLYLPPDELSDTILGGLTPSNFPTGLLHDRLLQEDTIVGYLTDYESNPSTAKNADLLYGVLMELDRMSTTPNLFDVQEIYEGVSAEVGKHQFESEQTVIPLGVIDYDYHDLDVDQGMSSQQLYFNGVVLTDMGSASAQLYSKKNVQMIAPMYDGVDLENLSFIFKPEWTFVDDQNKQVSSIKIQQNSQWINIPFNEPFAVALNDTLAIQTYNVKVTYVNQQEFIHTIIIQTPYLQLRSSEELPEAFCNSSSWKNNIFEDNDGNKLGWCLIQSCKSQQLDDDGEMFHNPMILLTGYRPPIFGQSFKKTWKIYNNYHDEFLNTLRKNHFDIFLVRFNIHAQPKKHGMQESADLLIKFLDWVNENKEDSYAENVMHASSMGADIGRLALMKMEHEHMTGTRAHHHTRLFNAYDGNFFGANIPLAYQYMIKTSAIYPNFTALTPSGVVRMGFNLFLNSFIRQKTVKELLMYHAYTDGLSATNFGSPIMNKNVTPTHHQLRQDYLDALASYDSGDHFIPLPYSTRNIAISLGKIRGTNDELTEPKFNASDDPWRNLWYPAYRYYLSPAKYNASDYEKLYRNWGVRYAFYTIPFGITHAIDVKGMQEIDNASGSYMANEGNVLEIADNLYWPLLYNGTRTYTHKAVLSAFAINKALWPTNGTHTLDMHDLELMYDDEEGDPQSDHYGYPNIGRPTDHFEVTPFEAIYIDNTPNHHINLKNDNATDRAILTSFMVNEYRPSILNLQNDHLGEQARSTYTYKSKRIAKEAIHTGFDVTYTTDKGYYVVEPNADLILEAGNYIELRPGTYTELGAAALIHIYYEECNELDALSENKRPITEIQSQMVHERQEGEANKASAISESVKLFPNPSSDGKFKIKSFGEDVIESIAIYDFQGSLIQRQDKIEMKSYYHDIPLDKGVYLVIAKVDGVSVSLRLVVL